MPTCGLSVSVARVIVPLSPQLTKTTCGAAQGKGRQQEGRGAELSPVPAF